MIPINNVVAKPLMVQNQNKQYSSVNICVTFASTIERIAPVQL
jgi:hypothetical protein